MTDNIGKVFTFLVPNSFENFNYALQYDTGKCVVFDPFDSCFLEKELAKRNLEITHIFITHEHGDHICGLEYFSQSDINIYCGKELNSLLKLSFSNVKILGNSESIELGPIKLKCIETFGHTMKHISYYYEHNKNCGLFCGDTLFSGGVGNCKNGGDPDVLFDTIERLKMSLPNKCLIYSGHDYLLNNLNFSESILPGFFDLNAWTSKWKNKKAENDHLISTIEDEKKINLFFNTDNDILQNKLGSIDARDTFVKLRKLRDNW